MLKYKRASGFTGKVSRLRNSQGKRLCVNSFKGDAATAHFHYHDSSVYVAVGDVSYIEESVVLGKSKRLDGESMALKISDVTIGQYIDDINLLPNDVSAMVVLGCCS